MNNSKEQTGKEAEDYLFDRGFEENYVTSNKTMMGLEYVSIDEVMDEWADIKSKLLQQRIAHLEAIIEFGDGMIQNLTAELKRKDEALTKSIQLARSLDVGHMWTNELEIAEQALKDKE